MIPKLKKLCENFIDISITCANVLSLLQYIDKLNLTSLKVNIINIIFFQNIFIFSIPNKIRSFV